MIDLVAEVLSEIAGWSEGCPCHADVPELAGATRHFRTKRMQFRLQHGSCPLRGRRSPELAARQVEVWVGKLLGAASARAAAVFRVAGLPQEQQGIILKDLAQARAHLVFTFQVKLAHWGRLPYLLCGLGHPSRIEAVQVAREIEAILERAPLDDQPPRVRNLLRSGSQGRQQLHMFAVGSHCILELPLLARVVAELRFVPTIERHVEGQHSILHRNTLGRPRAGPVHVAFTSILPRLREEFARDAAEFVSMFSLACAKVSNVLKGLVAVGLAHHPTVQTLGGVGRGTRRALARHGKRCLVEVIYHADDETLFLDHVGFQDRPGDDDSGDRPGPGAMDGLGEPLWQPQMQDAQTEVQKVWCQEALRFFQQVQCESCGDTVFSLGPRLSQSADAFSIASGKLILAATLPSRSESSLDFQFESDVRPGELAQPELDTTLESDLAALLDDHLGPEPRSVGQLTFFSVVKRTLGREKVVGVNAMAHLQRSSVLVRRLDIVNVDTKNKEISVSLDSEPCECREPFIMSLGALSVADLRTLRSWSSEVCVDSFCPAVESKLAPVAIAIARQQVGNLLSARALPGLPHHRYLVSGAADEVRASLDVLLCLANIGVVKQRSEFGSACFSLTEFGAATLQVRQRLSNPKQALSPRAGVPLADMTAFELLCQLESDGWSLQVAARGVPCVPYRSVAEGGVHCAKVIWAREGCQKVSQLYLRALQSAAEHQQEVKPFKTEAYYQSLMSGEAGQERGGQPGRRARFVFVSADQLAAPIGNLQCGKRATKRKRAGIAHAVAGGSDVEEEGQEEADHSEEGSEVPLDVLAESSSSSSNSSSSSSDSSSEGSSEPGQVTGATQPDVSGSGAAGSGALSSRSAMRITQTTEMWKSYKFTQVRSSGVHVGWEATCYRPQHCTDKMCRRTLRFGAGSDTAARNLVLQKLRWWCVAGEGCTDHAEHTSLSYNGPGGSLDRLPSLAALEQDGAGGSEPSMGPSSS